jgi:hypothetical protein
MQAAPVIAGLAILAVAVVAALAVIGRRMEKKRSDALRFACDEMGFVFETGGDLEQVKALGDFPLYGRGHSRKVKNVMTGRAGDHEVKLLDYQYTTGGGNHSHTCRQTVAVYPGAGTGLPDFILAPENVVHKIGQIFGYQDINFDSNPVFSSHYLLRGPDDMAIRSAFDTDTLSFLEQQQGWTVEVRGGSVAIYRAARRCDPGNVRTFVVESQAVLRALTHG